MSQQKQVWTFPKSTRINTQFDSVVQSEIPQGTHNQLSLSQNLDNSVALKDNNSLKSQQREEVSNLAEVNCQEWTTQEQNILIELHNKKGNKWVQIARQLKRNDNAVKNHYHSRLRKTIRKLNKCISDHLKGQFRLLKINLISKIVQTAQQLYQSNQYQQKEKSLMAYTLKNKVLSYAFINQQQITLQQLIEIKKLVSQIQEFDNLLKNTHKSDNKNKSTSNKYKGKEIIGLLNQNKKTQNTYLLSRKDNQNFNKISKYAQFSEGKYSPPDLQQGAKNIQIQNGQVQKSNVQNIGVYNCPTFLFFNQPYYSMQPLFYHIYQPSTGIFSGRQSSFTSYNPQSESITQNLSNWGTSSRLEDSQASKKGFQFKRSSSFNNSLC